MTVKKPTTTDDLTGQNLGESSELPKVEQESVETLTDPSVLAKVDAPKTVKVTSPLGDTTEVPEGIVDALLESGYTKGK